MYLVTCSYKFLPRYTYTGLFCHVGVKSQNRLCSGSILMTYSVFFFKYMNLVRSRTSTFWKRNPHCITPSLILIESLIRIKLQKVLTNYVKKFILLPQQNLTSNTQYTTNLLNHSEYYLAATFRVPVMCHQLTTLTTRRPLRCYRLIDVMQMAVIPSSGAHT